MAGGRVGEGVRGLAITRIGFLGGITGGGDGALAFPLPLGFPPMSLTSCATFSNCRMVSRKLDPEFGLNFGRALGITGDGSGEQYKARGEGRNGREEPRPLPRPAGRRYESPIRGFERLCAEPCPAPTRRSSGLNSSVRSTENMNYGASSLENIPLTIIVLIITVVVCNMRRD